MYLQYLVFPFDLGMLRETLRFGLLTPSEHLYICRFRELLGCDATFHEKVADSLVILDMLVCDRGFALIVRI